MLLKNKQTGEIAEASISNFELVVRYDDGRVEKYPLLFDYSNLEYYEEPKEYWFINDLDGKPMKCELRYCPVRDFDEWSEKRKKIGNYFSSREEAELTVRKLKAWKRLKDKGFRFDGFYDKSKQHILWHCGLPYITDDEFYKDLDLLFGGEE